MPFFEEDDSGIFEFGLLNALPGGWSAIGYCGGIIEPDKDYLTSVYGVVCAFAGIMLVDTGIFGGA